MGSYVYTAKSPTRTVIRDGEKIAVALIGYAYKPASRLYEDGYLARIISTKEAAGRKSRHAHKAKGISLYACEFMDGAGVFEAPDNFNGVTVDDYFFSNYPGSAKKIGTLKAVGKNRFEIVQL